MNFVTLDAFLCSPDSAIRLKRHLVFWACYSVYFYLQSLSPDCIKGLLPSDVYWFALNSVICFLPVCILCVYTCLHLLYPFLHNRNYFRFALGFLALGLVSVFLNYWFSFLFLKFSSPQQVEEIIFMRLFALGFLNSQNAFIAGGLALGIKLTKCWYQQKNENLALARRKMRTGLELLKVRIHPNYLFVSLDRIVEHIKKGSPDSPAMIINLSDLLNYWLYEGEEGTILLDDELSILRKFIALEEFKQTRLPRIEISVTGKTKDVYITPMILLPFLQTVCEDCYREKGRVGFMRLDIVNHEERLCFTLTADRPAKVKGKRIEQTEIVQNIIQRLVLYYPNSYQLNIMEIGDSMVIKLEMHATSLQTAPKEPSLLFHPPIATEYGFA